MNSTLATLTCLTIHRVRDTQMTHWVRELHMIDCIGDFDLPYTQSHDSSSSWYSDDWLRSWTPHDWKHWRNWLALHTWRQTRFIVTAWSKWEWYPHDSLGSWNTDDSLSSWVRDITWRRTRFIVTAGLKWEWYSRDSLSLWYTDDWFGSWQYLEKNALYSHGEVKIRV